MKINTLNNNFLAFQKKLAATCALTRKYNLIDCSIYELNATDDADYFKTLMDNDKDWTDATFFTQFKDALEPDYGSKRRVYVLEGPKNKCFAIAQANVYKDEIDLNYIVVNDKLRKKNKSRSIKYAGETLIAFFVKLASSLKLRDVFVVLPTEDAKPFYRKCNFIDSNHGFMSIDPNGQKGQDLIIQNEIHNLSRIGLVG